MNGYPLAQKQPREFISEIRFSDFEVSWVGPGAVEGTICFGSEDGRVRFTDLDGQLQFGMNKAIESGEAVNGIACIHRHMMVSSRDQIMLWTLPKDMSAQVMGAHIPFGSHGAIASESGYFFAPLGPKGILFCRPQDEDGQSINISSAGPGKVYFYRLVSLRSTSGQDVIASALRHEGIGIMEFGGENRQHIVNTHTFSQLDVVDLCPIKLGKEMGLAALGKDGTLILFRDAVREQKPLTIRYPSVKGVAYRILNVGTYLFLLTSRAAYFIADLLDHLPADNTQPASASILTLPMEAVDANVVGDRWVFVVLPDRVLRLDAERVPSADGPTNGVARISADQLQPEWEHREIAHSAIQAAVA